MHNLYIYILQKQTSTIMANTTINIVWIDTNIMKVYHYNWLYND